jgi:beta-phosphoglucomutase
MMKAAADLLRHRNCFLFDLDGTLVDSSACHEQAFVRALNTRRPDLLPSFCYERHKGQATRQVFEDLGVSDRQLQAEMTRDKQDFYMENVYAGKVALLPSAGRLLDFLQARGNRIFLVTGASSRSCRAVLSSLGLAERFDLVITGEDVARSKPSPDPYLECVRRAGLLAQECIVVEDAIAGIESARAAKLEVIVVNNTGLSQRAEYIGTLADLYDALLVMEGTPV